MKPLFDPGPADEDTLTDTQRRVLELLRDNPAGLTAAAVAVELSPDAWYGTSNARRQLVALKLAGLAIQRRGGVYQARHRLRDGKHDPETAPFPEGF